ncbi:MAG TPA: hypothetical protein VGX25_35300 [Actinophytocola sp.]|uniref:hypothetical protein n=1 Tax=Actinophytocola sp. TaxID=1872138 RepID=UPI002DDCA284|nr:hypothetical protein [Actinophytocola sp.]HEV2784681.1 hypothetical protein [Actinophytocola sp.]
MKLEIRIMSRWWRELEKLRAEMQQLRVRLMTMEAEREIEREIDAAFRDGAHGGRQ